MQKKKTSDVNFSFNFWIRLAYVIILVLLEAYTFNYLFDKRMYDPESKIWDKIYVTNDAKKWAPEVVDYSDKMIDLLQKGNVSGTLKLFESGDTKIQSALAGVESYLGNSEISKKEIIKFNYHIAYKDSSDREINSEYLLKLNKNSQATWYDLKIDVHKMPNSITAQNISGFPITQELIDAASFSLNAGPLNYLMLFLAVIIPAFNLWVIFLWFQTKMKWKWLWLPLIFVGISFFGFYWSYSYFDFSTISFGINFPGEKFFKGAALTPWVLVIYVPVGSFVFLWKLKKSDETSNHN